MNRILLIGLLLGAIFSNNTALTSYSMPLDTFLVTNTKNSGTGSLRQAIIDANNRIGEDTIEFSIPILDPGYSSLYGIWRIQPTSIFPSLIDNGTIIDGGTQTTNQGDNNPFGPEILLDGSSLGGSTPLISIQSNYNAISNMVISNSPGVGVNIITGASNNLVNYNYIGVSPTSMSSWANETGVQITSGASHNHIEDNIIAGNSHDGVVISGTNTQGNLLCRNLIGLDRTGTGASPNGWDGVYLTNGAHHNEIGAASCMNIISGNNLRGVFITGSGTDNNNIHYNKIGTDTTGHHSLNDVGNTNSGVRIDGGAIGASIKHNIISGNHDHGIYIAGSGTNNHFIFYNTIGGSAVPIESLPNHNHGIAIYDFAGYNYLGNTVSIGANIIVSNGWSGIALVNSFANTINGNYIGTEPNNLDNPLGNKFHGVDIVGEADNSVTNNIIAHNGTSGTGIGVKVDGNGATGNRISQNSIHDNAGKGIELRNGGNNSLFTPSITLATCNYIEGSACSNCTVEIFNDDNGEGRAYHGKTTASAILPAFDYNGFLFGPNITVTMIDGNLNTSEYSLPVIAGCEYIHLPLTFGKP